MDLISFNDGIETIVQTFKSYKILCLSCKPATNSNCIEYLLSHHIPSINIGIILSEYIAGLENDDYIEIDVYDYLMKIIEEHSSYVEGVHRKVIAIYNLGILLETSFQLHVVRLFKEISKAYSLIIIWDQIYLLGKLCWATQQTSYFFSFSEMPIKVIDYAI